MTQGRIRVTGSGIPGGFRDIFEDFPNGMPETHNFPFRPPMTDIGGMHRDIVQMLDDMEEMPSGMMIDQAGGIIGMLALAAMMEGAGCDEDDTYTSSSSRTMITIDEDGNINGRRTGHEPKFIPLSELDTEIADMAMKIAGLHTEFGQKRTEGIKIQKELSQMREKTYYESIEIRHAIWDQYPKYMRQNNVEIKGQGDAFILVVNGDPTNETVPQDFGSEIVSRQVALSDLEARITSFEGELDANRNWLSAKPELFSTMNSKLDSLLNEKHPDLTSKNAKLVKHSDTGDPCFVITVPINETLTEIPDDIKAEIAAKYKGKEIPPKIAKALGIEVPAKQIAEGVADIVKAE